MKLMQYVKNLFFGVLSLLVLGAIIFGILVKSSLPKDSGELATLKLARKFLFIKTLGEFLI